MIESYDASCVGNLDETGLLFKFARKSSHVTEEEAKDKDLRGSKQSKERLTILVGAYMDGEKLPLLAIGKSAKPRCFRGSPIPIIYRNQPNSWMDYNIFNEYLLKIDSKLTQKKDKNVYR